MSTEIKYVLMSIESVINKKITFKAFMRLSNTLRMFIEDCLYDAFNDYVHENVDEFESTESYEDALFLLDKLYHVKTDEVYKTVEFKGGEGQGDSWIRVIQHIESERYMSCEGYYASYHGYDSDGCEYIEVKPVEVTVIDYEAI